MEYYIAIDSGGTKTETILADGNGRVLERRTDPGCNPLDVGAAQAKKTIWSCVEELTAMSPGPVVSIYGAVAGANHVDLGLERDIRERSPEMLVRIEDDRRAVVSGTLGHRDGCGLICGTGSSLSIVKEGQPIRQVGGLGYLIDTGGSGYELGQAGLKQACRYLDGRGEPTLLAQLITQALGASPWESMAQIYAGGRSFIASLAHLVFEAAAMGDEVSCRIIEEGAAELAELTYAAQHSFDGPFPVVMTGGIFMAYPDYQQLVCEKASPMARMTTAKVPPIYGALVEALWQRGRTAGEDTRLAFISSYGAATRKEGRATCCHRAI